MDELDKVVPLQGILGYLNFSEGRPDARVQKQVNDAYAFLAGQGQARPWEILEQCLRTKLADLHQGQASAFRNIDQAGRVLDLIFQKVVPAYRTHHVDLLFDLPETDFFKPFFLVRVAEAVLAQRGPWEETERIVQGALRQLNDYVGHRPIVILETRLRGEPYDHEQFRPIPLYLKGAGVAWGRYEALIRQALEILQATDKNILTDAYFDLELLDELAVDPRGYDFGHPADKRPNYCFGEWDPHHIDGKGYFRRFVLRQVTLEGLRQYAKYGPSGHPSNESAAEEWLFDAGSVLAGIMLMASGVSGSGPTTHDSSVTLSTLVPRIARARDTFYAQLLKSQSGTRARRLAQEAKLARQPFGGVRQSLNQYLARQRAWQIQQRRLALLLAELGHPHAARRAIGLTEEGKSQEKNDEQSARTNSVAGISTIPASVRLLTEIHVRLTTGSMLVERGRIEETVQLLLEIEGLLQRGIACGAVVDPWNILGFQGLYPRFTALEDSVHDPRIEDLVHVVYRIFYLYGRVLSEEAASKINGDVPGGTQKHDVFGKALQNMRRCAEWWDRFATLEVGDVPHVHGREAVASAEHVARALSRWREKGEADLSFWKHHLEGFRSPKSFALVIEALLGKEDFRAALGLLMAWLGQAEQVPLAEEDHSFHTLALQWMLGVWAWSGAGGENSITPAAIDLVIRFFDHLEANAEEHWQVPHLNPLGIADEQAAEKPQGRAEEESLYGAAYEGVTYKDSTDDDVEGEVLDIMPQKDFDLAAEEPRLEKRLQFLSTLARLWNVATRILRHAHDKDRPRGQQHLQQWLGRGRYNYHQLLGLLDALHQHEVPRPTGSFESMVEFDKRRGVKENLLNLAITTCLDQYLAVGAMRGIVDDEEIAAVSAEPLIGAEAGEEKAPSWEPQVLHMERALLHKGPERVRVILESFLEKFSHEPLLYTPLSQGGHPRQILRASLAQTILRGLVANLPRQGLIQETYAILKTARDMEKKQHLPGPRVTEFDRLYQLGCQASVEAVVDSALASAHEVEPSAPDPTDRGDAPAANPQPEVQNREPLVDKRIVDSLEILMEPFLALWMDHSKNLRISMLEAVETDEEWHSLGQFIKRYGKDLFNARFMTLANLRGILHRGVGGYLDYLAENQDPARPLRLIEELNRKCSRQDAVRFLQIILQTLIENYDHYRDYNATTTQSDYGDNLYQFLDFLQIKMSYERQAWQLKPLNLVHEVLARRHPPAAELWRHQTEEITREWAEEHLKELAELEKGYGMRLTTIRDRLQERFVEPLAIDGLCALVAPALEQARQTFPEDRHLLLEEMIHPFAAKPTGVGLDVPPWLARLENEFEHLQASRTALASLAETLFQVPKVIVPFDHLEKQLPAKDPENEK